MKNWQRLYLKENLFFIYEINNHNGYISDSIQLMTLKTKSYLDKKKTKKKYNYKNRSWAYVAKIRYGR